MLSNEFLNTHKNRLRRTSGEQNFSSFDFALWAGLCGRGKSKCAKMCACILSFFSALAKKQNLLFAWSVSVDERTTNLLPNCFSFLRPPCV
jgi:hypothetical protein